MQKFSLSANIENEWVDGTHYISTPNAKRSIASVVNGFHTGIHSYTIIGTYGTGKSSFLLALEKDLKSNSKQKLLLDNPLVFGKNDGFEILNIVGDYSELSSLIAEKLGVEANQKNVLNALKELYDKCRTKEIFLIIVIDEFGKVLEHAAEKNPEKELYFLQKLAEFVNVPTRNILLITTLHQNFSSYGKKLSEEQKNEWTKVKGRFKEVAFVEPVEQIMFLAAKQREKIQTDIPNEQALAALQQLAEDSKFISDSYTYEAAKSLFPLDPFSAYVITRAIQRYGQNERSLFSFISTKGRNSFREFMPQEKLTYNLQIVYDYIENNFFSYLQEANSDSMGWSGIHTAIERVEGQTWTDEKDFQSAIKIVKAIGILNLFGTAVFKWDANAMARYAKLAMDVDNAKNIIKQLEHFKIIRYAEYKSRLLLFEGTDVNIEDELLKAGLVVPKPVNYVDDIRFFFAKRISLVKACYYHRGTPRYFNHIVLAEPEDITPKNDTDGFVELLFPTSSKDIESIRDFSSQCDKAIIFVVFNNTKDIVDHIYNINKYDYLLQKVLIDKNDTVANKEMINLKDYETEMLNKAINEGLFSYNHSVIWIYKGKEQVVRSQREFNQLLSLVCNDIYYLAPIMNNELINRHKLSSNISSAKAKYIEALVEHSDLDDFGFSKDKFPPEKTIYYSLLKDTGLHEGGSFNEAPQNENINTLWTACEDFLASSSTKARKISELQRVLLSPPYKMKQGFLDFWIPTYLFIKRQDYSLYEVKTGAYIPNVNREFFELLQKHSADYSIKAFNENGVQLAFYNQYRKFINVVTDTSIKSNKFIETIKPFFYFYSHLNEYAKHTGKFDHESTLRFREVLSNAKDPEKTFFEDLPKALGYSKDNLKQEEFMQDYCNLIQRAVKELRSCYNRLIDRIEEYIVDGLSLSSYEYSNYVVEIRNRLKSVKTYLLTGKQQEFYNHVMSEFDNRTEWYQSICYTAIDQRLELLQDEQEELLDENLLFLFDSCEKYASISTMLNDSNKEDEAFSFDLVGNDGESFKKQTYILPKKDRQKSEQLEEQISKLLTGNENMDVCTLLRILKRNHRNEG